MTIFFYKKLFINKKQETDYNKISAKHCISSEAIKIAV